MGGGPPDFPQGFTCLVVLWIPPAASGFPLRGFHPLRPDLPVRSGSLPPAFLRSLTPARSRAGFGCFPFARRYSGNRRFFLFLRLLRCFSSAGSLRRAMDSRAGARGLPGRVSPFRHLRISGHLLLPEAFRSLSRLSSALSAKASALRPFLLDQSPVHSVAPGFRLEAPLQTACLLLFSCFFFRSIGSMCGFQGACAPFDLSVQRQWRWRDSNS